MERGCMNCGAYFEEKTDNETLKILRNHLEKCSEESPFLKDDNAKGYHES